MGKIIFYEHKNFGGRHHECNGDCADLRSYFSCCNSIKVESGCFMIYEQSDYTGNQYFLKKGDYTEYHLWMGSNDSVCSCCAIPTSSFKIHLYERMEFGGQMMDLTEDCPCLMDRFHMNDIFSCKVMTGHWLFYERPNFRGRMYLIKPGEYKRFSEWGGINARVGSIKRILDY
ncbi:gamma-crystallin 2-like [Chanos chanos]|uniref:Gamma-crystallin 2-like n=1 Tax=Chanos chanos TaxID=29144 RepID=A0A6J2WEH3_CHACN|nr:gamma-crystallin 2-like [Chanos chanos]